MDVSLFLMYISVLSSHSSHYQKLLYVQCTLTVTFIFCLLLNIYVFSICSNFLKKSDFSVFFLELNSAVFTERYVHLILKLNK